MVQIRSRPSCGSGSEVEHRLAKARVASSNLVYRFICGCSSVVEPQPSKLVTRVRFPSPADVPLAQLDRASGYGPEGLGFESSMVRDRRKAIFFYACLLDGSIINFGIELYERFVD